MRKLTFYSVDDASFDTEKEAQKFKEHAKSKDEVFVGEKIIYSSLEEYILDNDKKNIITKALEKLNEEEIKALGLEKGTKHLLPSEKGKFITAKDAIENQKLGFDTRTCKILIQYFASKGLVEYSKNMDESAAKHALRSIPYDKAVLNFDELEFRAFHKQNHHYGLAEKLAQKIIRAFQ